MAFFLSQPINVSSSGTTLLIPGVPGVSIVVINYAVVVAATINVQFLDTATNVLSGPIPCTANAGVSFAGSIKSPAFKLGVGLGLQISLSGAVLTGGHVGYVLE